MVLVGAITGPHGVKGEVKVKTFTAEPSAVAAYGPLFDAKGQRRFDLTLHGKGGGKGIVVARIAGIEGRDQAEALKGQQLFVPRAALPKLADDEEFYLADLVGLQVEDRSGAKLGRVTEVQNHGAGDVVTVEGGPKGAFDLSFTKAFVPVVDLAAGRIVADLPDDFFTVPERAPEEYIGDEDAGEVDDEDEPKVGR
jgi:16S rRNA processing protein RimM